MGGGAIGYRSSEAVLAEPSKWIDALEDNRWLTDIQINLNTT